MACYHPVYLAGDPVVDESTGEVKIKNKRIASTYEEFLKVSSETVSGRRYYPVPCGKCFGCKLDFARSWSVRNMMESASHDLPSYYLTLTYSDDNVHRADYVFNPTIGQVVQNASILVKEDLIDFMKLLRETLRDRGIQDEGVRFFACGEYGPLTFRSHFHVLLYNCLLPDLRPLTLSESVNAPPWCLTSDLVLHAWKDRGFVSISEFNYARAAYVSRYVVKKQVAYSHEDYIESHVKFLQNQMTYYEVEPHVFIPVFEKYPGIQRLPKEFVHMSRNPGVGRPWIDSNTSEREFISDGKRFSLPRSVLKFMDAETVLELQAARQDRAKAITNLKLASSNRPLEQILESEELVKRDQYFKFHVRPL